MILVSAAADLARLEAIVDASGAAGRIKGRLPVGVRPRQLTVRTLLLGMPIALSDGRPAHLRRIHEAICLPEADRRRLGAIVSWKTGPHELTYRKTERTFGLVNRALSKTSRERERRGWGPDFAPRRRSGDRGVA